MQNQQLNSFKYGKALAQSMSISGNDFIMDTLCKDNEVFSPAEPTG